jgi:hypothetical protein
MKYFLLICGLLLATNTHALDVNTGTGTAHFEIIVDQTAPTITTAQAQEWEYSRTPTDAVLSFVIMNDRIEQFEQGGEPAVVKKSLASTTAGNL